MEARSRVAFDQLELLVNGCIRASKTASGNRMSAILETEVTLTESSWMAARCWGHETLPGDAGQCVYAHTSPVYLRVEGKPIRPGPETLAPLVKILDRTEEWVRRQARCETEKQRAHLIGVFESGRQNLHRRAE